MYHLAVILSPRSHNHKMSHQTNTRLILDIYLCDLQVWVKVITANVEARSQWTASMVLTMYLQVKYVMIYSHSHMVIMEK